MEMRASIPSRDEVAALMRKSDEWWYSGMLEPSFCGKTLTSEEKADVMRRSIETAEGMYRYTADAFRGSSTQDAAQMLGINLRLVNRDEFFGNGHILALFDPKINTIQLCEETINALCRFICQRGLTDIVGERDIKGTALYHEIFHAFEERMPGIYTRSRMLERKFLFFNVRQGLDTAGEIGAIHFSKLMSGLDFSPCLYQYLLIALNGSVVPDAWKPNRAN